MKREVDIWKVRADEKMMDAEAMKQLNNKIWNRAVWESNVEAY